MNQRDLEAHLQNLPLGGVRFFSKTSSTNDDAAAWVEQGCPDLGVVVADEQTAGRGHAGHKWFTPPGSALAFSLVLRVDEETYPRFDLNVLTRITGLGALSVCQPLQDKYKLPAKIKWPNDILVDGKKLAGILAEGQWTGNELDAIILGIGINVATESIPPADWDDLNPSPFPATCMESALKNKPNRWDLLYAVLAEVLKWRSHLFSAKFIDFWQKNLAFQDEWVQVNLPNSGETHLIGRIIGLDHDGALRLQKKSGELIRLAFGEIQPADLQCGGFYMRPVDSSKK